MDGGRRTVIWVSVMRGPASGGDGCDLAGLRGLWLPLPDGAVGHDVAVGAPPLDLAAFELLLVQRRVDAALAQQRAVGAGFGHASGVDDVDDVGVDDGGQAMGDGDGGP